MLGGLLTGLPLAAVCGLPHPGLGLVRVCHIPVDPGGRRHPPSHSPSPAANSSGAPGEAATGTTTAHEVRQRNHACRIVAWPRRHPRAAATPWVRLVLWCTTTSDLQFICFLQLNNRQFNMHSRQLCVCRFAGGARRLSGRCLGLEALASGRSSSAVSLGELIWMREGMLNAHLQS